MGSEFFKNAMIICQDEEDLKRLFNACEKSELVAFDFETSGLDIIQDYPVGLSIAPSLDLVFYLPFTHLQRGLGGYKNLDILLVEKYMEKIFSLEVSFVAHNSKFDLAFLKRFVILPFRVEDTFIMQQLIDINARAGLKILSEKYFEVKPVHFKEITGKKKSQDIPIEILGKYCCDDSYYTLKLFPILEKKLDSLELRRVYELELAVLRVLLNMELIGVLISKKRLQSAIKGVKLDISKSQKQIYKLLETEINLNSPAQLLATLRKRGIKINDTQKRTLKELREDYKVISLILKFREQAKLLHTYLEGLPKYIKSTGKVYTTFRQIIDTGRMSSTKPNLQQLPVKTGKTIVRGAVTTSKGYKLVSFDYNQMELRVLTHYSQEPELIKAYLNGEDIHQKTMDLVGIPRLQAKTVNFGVVYGMTSKGLANNLEISVVEAEKFISKYFKAYPKVKSWKHDIIQKARQEKLVKTISGRKRILYELTSPNIQQRMAAEREAVNTIIQGSAADIMKQALIDVSKETIIYKDRVRLLLPVHDELLVEIKEDMLSKVIPIIIKSMSSAWELRVPLVVEAKVGDNWGEMEEFQVE